MTPGIPGPQDCLGFSLSARHAAPACLPRGSHLGLTVDTLPTGAENSCFSFFSLWSFSSEENGFSSTWWKLEGVSVLGF